VLERSHAQTAPAAGLRAGDKTPLPGGDAAGPRAAQIKGRLGRDGPEPREETPLRGVTESRVRGTRPVRPARLPTRSHSPAAEPQPRGGGGGGGRAGLPHGATDPRQLRAGHSLAGTKPRRDGSLFPSRPRDPSGFAPFLQQTALSVTARREVSQGSQEGI